jgi:hypothetical protein
MVQRGENDEPSVALPALPGTYALVAAAPWGVVTIECDGVPRLGGAAMMQGGLQLHRARRKTART